MTHIGRLRDWGKRRDCPLNGHTPTYFEGTKMCMRSLNGPSSTRPRKHVMTVGAPWPPALSLALSCEWPWQEAGRGHWATARRFRSNPQPRRSFSCCQIGKALQLSPEPQSSLPASSMVTSTWPRSAGGWHLRPSLAEAWQHWRAPSKASLSHLHPASRPCALPGNTGRPHHQPGDFRFSAPLDLTHTSVLPLSLPSWSVLTVVRPWLLHPREVAIPTEADPLPPGSECWPEAWEAAGLGRGSGSLQSSPLALGVLLPPSHPSPRDQIMKRNRRAFTDVCVAEPRFSTLEIELWATADTHRSSISVLALIPGSHHVCQGHKSKKEVGSWVLQFQLWRGEEEEGRDTLPSHLDHKLSPQPHQEALPANVPS